MRQILQQLKQYKRDTFLCIGLTTLEVVMEILLPFITAMLIDQGLEASNMPIVYRYGILMVVMAFLSLAFGALGRENLLPVRRQAWQPIYGKRFMPISRHFPSLTLISLVYPAWLHG